MYVVMVKEAVGSNKFMLKAVRKTIFFLTFILCIGLIFAACGEEKATSPAPQGNLINCGLPGAPECGGEDIPVPTICVAGSPAGCILTGTVSYPTPTPASLGLEAAATVAATRMPTQTPLPPTHTPVPPGGIVIAARPIPINFIGLDTDERELSFNVGPNTVYGTLKLPNSNNKQPAALLLADSGATDRNGNSSAFKGQVNTLLNFAKVLNDNGVVTFRYDKIGSGKTGLGSFAINLGGLGFDDYLEEAAAAYELLRNRPEVDPQRIVIVGQGEGALLALLLADRYRGENAPKALALATPYARPYTEFLREQVIESQQFKALPQADADATLAELERILKSLTDSGKLPTDISPLLRNFFSPLNEKYLGQIVKHDPARLAEKLPDTPVLMMCGQRDLSVSCGTVQNLLQDFTRGGNQKAELAELSNVGQGFKELPSGATPTPFDHLNPNYLFSGEAKRKLGDFAKTTL
jgi:uncharacterized protein